jgi:hypothetical protein
MNQIGARKRPFREYGALKKLTIMKDPNVLLLRGGVGDMRAVNKLYTTSTPATPLSKLIIWTRRASQK